MLTAARIVIRSRGIITSPTKHSPAEEIVLNFKRMVSHEISRSTFQTLVLTSRDDEEIISNLNLASLLIAKASGQRINAIVYTLTSQVENVIR